MMKLDNKGWGFAMFIAFIFVFLLAILMIAYMVNHFETGLSSERDDNITYTQHEIYRKYEKLVKKAAESAFSNHTEEYININDLDISNAIKSECVGYVLLDSSSLEYTAYLKCGNYQTANFSPDFLR